jgi:hypothetical protein
MGLMQLPLWIQLPAAVALMGLMQLPLWIQLPAAVALSLSHQGT